MHPHYFLPSAAYDSSQHQYYKILEKKIITAFAQNVSRLGQQVRYPVRLDFLFQKEYNDNKIIVQPGDRENLVIIGHSI